MNPNKVILDKKKRSIFTEFGSSGAGGTGLITDAAFGPGMALDSVQQGFAFLYGELEKRDPMLLEPLASITYPRDIVVQTGGGFCEYVSYSAVQYGTVGANGLSFTAKNTTEIPVIQANLNKTNIPTVTKQISMAYSFLDLQAAQAIPRSLDEIYNNGIMLDWNKTLDALVYTGFSDFDTVGLVNNPAIASSLALANGTGSSRLFSAKTGTQIVAELNALLNRAIARAEYDQSAIPNQILMPPAVMSDLRREMNTAAASSILEYFLNNNVLKDYNVDLVVVPCRQTIGVGTPSTTGGAGTNRIVAYCNNQRFVSFDLTVPLSRGMSGPVIDQGRYVTNYWGQFSPVLFKYTQPMEYLDGV